MSAGASCDSNPQATQECIAYTGLSNSYSHSTRDNIVYAYWDTPNVNTIILSPSPIPVTNSGFTYHANTASFFGTSNQLSTWGICRCDNSEQLLQGAASRTCPANYHLNGGTLQCDPNNTAPTASNINRTINENTPTNIGAVFTDPDAGNTHGVEAVTQPANGTVTTSGTTMRYTPPANWTGTTSYTYRVWDNSWAASTTRTVTVNVSPVNDAPSIASTRSRSTAEDTPTSFSIPVTDIDSGTHTLHLVSGPSNGSVSFSGTTVTYTPGINYNGTTSFRIRARDGALYSGNQTITMTVTPVNDAPSIASSQSRSLDEGGVINFPVAVTDPDNATHTLQLVSGPSQGSVTFSGTTVRYAAPGDWVGTATFVVRARDGALYSGNQTITMTVMPLNDQPIISGTGNIVIDEDTSGSYTESTIVDPDIGDTHTLTIVSYPLGGSVSISGMVMTFTPNSNWNGSTYFTYQARDAANWGSNVKQVNITVNPVNDVPTITGGAMLLDDGTMGSVTIVVVDPDAGDTHTLSEVTAPGGGTGSISGLDYTFTAASPDDITTTATVQVTDSGGAPSNIATININVQQHLTVNVGVMQTLPVAQQLLGQSDTPISVIEAGPILANDGSVATGTADFEFTLSASAAYSVVVQGVTIDPGNSHTFTYDFSANGGRIYIPVYPATTGVEGDAEYKVRFDRNVSTM